MVATWRQLSLQQTYPDDLKATAKSVRILCLETAAALKRPEAIQSRDNCQPQILQSPAMANLRYIQATEAGKRQSRVSTQTSQQRNISAQRSD
jgi:hypothetical protein